MIFTDDKGKQYEWKGVYRNPEQGDYFMAVHGIGKDGSVVKHEHYVWSGGERAIVHPVLKIIEEGGIEFEIVDERQAREGEWYRNREGRVTLAPRATTGGYEILKPRRVL